VPEEPVTRHVLLDELHVQLLIPPGLTGPGLRAARRAAHGRDFRRAAVRAVRRLLAERKLAAVRVRLAR
jgi:hypothetical protein